MNPDVHFKKMLKVFGDEMTFFFFKFWFLCSIMGHTQANSCVA